MNFNYVGALNKQRLLLSFAAIFSSALLQADNSLGSPIDFNSRKGNQAKTSFKDAHCNPARCKEDLQNTLQTFRQQHKNNPTVTITALPFTITANDSNKNFILAGNLLSPSSTAISVEDNVHDVIINLNNFSLSIPAGSNAAGVDFGGTVNNILIENGTIQANLLPTQVGGVGIQQFNNAATSNIYVDHVNFINLRRGLLLVPSLPGIVNNLNVSFCNFDLRNSGAGMTRALSLTQVHGMRVEDCSVLLPKRNNPFQDIGIFMDDVTNFLDVIIRRCQFKGCGEDIEIDSEGGIFLTSNVLLEDIQSEDTLITLVVREVKNLHVNNYHSVPREGGIIANFDISFPSSGVFNNQNILFENSRFILNTGSGATCLQDFGIDCHSAVLYRHIQNVTFRNCSFSGSANIYLDMGLGQGPIIFGGENAFVVDKCSFEGAQVSAINVQQFNNVTLTNNIIKNGATGITIADSNVKVYNNKITNNDVGINVSSTYNPGSNFRVADIEIGNFCKGNIIKDNVKGVVVGNVSNPLAPIVTGILITKPQDPIEPSPGMSIPNEEAALAIDQSLTTTYSIRTVDATISLGFIVAPSAHSPSIVTGMNITNARRPFIGRNPLAITLWGSNVAPSFNPATLEVDWNATFWNRIADITTSWEFQGQTKGFTFPNTTPYTYYKWEVTKLQNIPAETGVLEVVEVGLYGNATLIQPYPTGVQILSNSMSNKQIGIDLGNDGISANHNTQAGPNHWQNKPKLELLSLSKCKGKIEGTLFGTLESIPNETYILQIFANTEKPAVNPEGKCLLLSQLIATDTQGVVHFAASLHNLHKVKHLDRLTATVTRISTRDTSEFSSDNYQITCK